MEVSGGLRNLLTHKIFLPQGIGVWGRKILLVEKFYGDEVRVIVVKVRSWRAMFAQRRRVSGLDWRRRCRWARCALSAEDRAVRMKAVSGAARWKR
jgi:hypothetical protein